MPKGNPLVPISDAEEAIKESKKALEGDNIDTIKAAQEKLQQAGYKLAEVAYSNNGDAATAAAASAAPQPNAAPSTNDDGPIEADYEVVDPKDKQ